MSVYRNLKTRLFYLFIFLNSVTMFKFINTILKALNLLASTQVLHEQSTRNEVNYRTKLK